ncbi:hypothetical protein [Hydrogenivirga sp. 128-5-R1-1]|uniref:Spy/CpxP family protein refolding chaperone n=1 Tax=Hydrogenivirga sp. 128-5-R1-1 TaxID=392423 RepID=UPI00015F1828|nr:hypothetical protein [Hydrogenivirga sp. 128-5-R1-1]EDP76030.1 hypothetical protein HG1285_17709 [Hydrogenivirga sp. 128-5-R1-1]
MKKIILALMLLGSLSLAQEGIGRYYLVERVFLMPFVFKYADELGLDSEQMKKIKEFVKKNEKEVERNRKILEYLNRKAKLMILDGSEEKEIREVLADIASVKMEMSLLNAKSVRFLKSTLTPEQFQRLKDIVVVRLFELQQ